MNNTRLAELYLADLRPLAERVAQPTGGNMNTYIAIYNGKEREIMASTLYGASVAAVEYFKIPRSKRGMLGVYLAAKGDEPVTIDPASL